MTIDDFIAQLTDVSLDDVFNPYRDRCEIFDCVDAPAIRRMNLKAYMGAAKACATSIWFGRDLGYRGGRRTGLALTDEAHLPSIRMFYKGAATKKATIGPTVTERTASVVWGMVAKLQEPPFLWNIFPFHPHEPGEPFSNRCHRTNERQHCEVLIGMLVDWLKPREIIAIGNVAYATLSTLGYSCKYVRHPSHGGQTKFINGISSIYRLTSVDNHEVQSIGLSTIQERSL